MEKGKPVIIIGGGLAGLTAAIHLSKLGLQIILIEKNEFPKHKVCGEYISNEVMPYLNWLDLNILDLGPTKINNLEFSTVSGKAIRSVLPLGGFGISRYAFDQHLYKKAIANGCEIIQDTVDNIDYDNGEFSVTTFNNRVLKTEILIGAFGKRSNIDQKLRRTFIQRKSPWLAVKGHYSGFFSEDLVGLHNFEGGYCGVSMVENKVVNICYLADYKTFSSFKNINEFQNSIVFKNPHLKTIFDNSKLLFEKPLTISQISFEEKNAVENHILMVGDTAGLIHPLCGNGMAMAIHSAKIVSELIMKFYTNEISSREELEQKYTQQWNLNFGKRVAMGRILSTVLQRQKISKIVMRIVVLFPFLVPLIIKRTHGKPISITL